MSELPAVVSDGIESIQKTKQALEALKQAGCEEEPGGAIRGTAAQGSETNFDLFFPRRRQNNRPNRQFTIYL